eukprot:TRINITY_DN7520_c0_g1_i32.p1 TRINITY_DN7520_c0_g1~~TRINITY_DN7520_c0_g1_i32.p1  ORF type:complete len:249 (+),score=36.13 TRINITY_DN7520_c0_g1_i32:66-749(+)
MCIRDSNETVNAINTNLHGQEEKIDKMNKTAKDLNNELNKSSYLSKSVKSTWGLFKSLFTKPKIEKDDDYVLKQDAGNDNRESSGRAVPGIDKTSHVQTSVHKTTTPGPTTESDQLIDELLEEAGKMKKGSQLIGESIDRSNKKLDLLNKNVDRAERKMDHVNNDLSKCLKKQFSSYMMCTNPPCFYTTRYVLLSCYLIIACFSLSSGQVYRKPTFAHIQQCQQQVF